MLKKRLDYLVLTGLVFFLVAFVLPMMLFLSAPAWADTMTEPEEAPPATAVFAGGCFWCMEPPFDQLAGVGATTSGYTGGTVASPSYFEVSNGTTGHVEAVQVSYDPQRVSYGQLLEVFWRNVDPLDSQGQFCDKGSQYKSVIFVANDIERQAAEQSKQQLAETLGTPIATEIQSVQPFYPAEAYHQNYYQTHPLRYKVYRFGCGRDQRLRELFPDFSGH
jgi:peptide-methionine (S)-S-oxide reductase